MLSLVSSIVNDKQTKDLLSSYGLKSHYITYEDTARSKGSCFGPNISDMTLTVKGSGVPRDNPKMPIIRKPNYADVTDDVPIDTFKLPVGNQNRGATKKVVSLKEFLSHLNEYTNSPTVDLSLPRDSVVLTSSQCCVLPVSGRDTEFAVQLFNYQSSDSDPAVLVILVSKEGTSCQVLDDSNQKLFFNDKGTAKWFKIERLADVREKRTGQPQQNVNSFTEMKDDEKAENVLMVIQVPLKVRKQTRSLFTNGVQNQMFDFALNEKLCLLSSMPTRGMNMGVVGVGSSAGLYTGTKGLTFERDERFPIRCTFQYYRTTDQGYINERNVKDIAEQLAQQTKVSVASGSLVYSDDSKRVTEPNLSQPVPSDNPFGFANNKFTTFISSWMK